MDGAQYRDRANQLRTALADRVAQRGMSSSSRVLAAVATVPRHVFLPGETLDVAYADQQVYTKWDAAGEAVSAASKPSVVAMMLDQLQVRPGARVLEIGTGTGYNAALLCELVGPAGEVTTVEVDPDLADQAGRALAAAGYGQVAVICRDGEHGFLPAAPYDRIIVTAGAGDLPPAWRHQLAEGGRLVVPLRIRGSAQRSIAFVREAEGWVAGSTRVCSFMPMRGGDAAARRTVTLPVPGQTKPAALHVYPEEQVVEPAWVRDVFAGPAGDAWTGVRFGGGESFDGLELWLACHYDGLCRLQLPAAGPDRAARSALPWGSPAVVVGDNLAYLTVRGVSGGGVEVGVRGHGPGGGELAARLASLIGVWGHEFREVEPRIEAQPAAVAGDGAGFVIDMRHVRLIIDWGR